jgi:hypothetical protein
MNTRMSRYGFIFGVLLAVSVAGNGHAEARAAATGVIVHSFSDSSNMPRTTRQQGNLLAAAVDAQGAAQIAQQSYGGEVLRVSRNGSEFRVKLRISGEIIIVRVDAASGQILGR